MKRQRTLQPEFQIHKLPDSINCSPVHNFTQIPNDLLRDPELSFKAKGLICCLLSNQDGWTSHMSQLEKLSDKDGETSIRSGMSELEEQGYMLRMVYRDEKKQVIGSFLAYTNSKWEFDLKPRLDKISSMGYSASLQPHTKRRLEKLSLANLYLGQLILANPALKILIDKNTNIKKEQIGGNGESSSTTSPHEDDLPEPVEEQDIKPSHKDKATGLVGTHSIEYFPEHLQKDPIFIQSWDEWCQYRRTNPKTPPIEKLTVIGFKKTVKEMLSDIGSDPSDLSKAIDNAMARGWRGIFKPVTFCNNSNGNGKKPTYGPLSTCLTPEEAKAKYGGFKNGDVKMKDGIGYVYRDGDWREYRNGKEIDRNITA